MMGCWGNGVMGGEQWVSGEMLIRVVIGHWESFKERSLVISHWSLGER
jgi:hypothetical protein